MSEIIFPEILKFSEGRCPAIGDMQIIMMRGEKPIIVGSKILINRKKTEIIINDRDPNLVVDEGRLTIRQVMEGSISADPIKYFCTGTGGYIGEPDCSVDPSPPLGSDTDLYNLIFQKEITEIVNPNALASTFITIVEEPESHGTLTEFALKTESGRIFARRTTRPMYKDDQVFFVCRWTIQY